MTISSHQIHSVLRTYGKQLRRGIRLNRMKNVNAAESGDRIRISPEAKRLQVIDRVASEILFRLSEPSAQWGDVEKEIMATLSKEYGHALALSYHAAKEVFQFSIMDEKSGEIIKALDDEEAAFLQNRLVEITRSVVDRNML